MSAHRLLLEIGTEEMPPGELTTLCSALGENLRASLRALDFDVGDDVRLKTFCTPRRLTIDIGGFAGGEAKREEHSGPKLEQCFDEKGRPTKAGEGFCASRGLRLREAPEEFPQSAERIRRLWAKLPADKPRLYQRDGRLLVVCHRRAPAPKPRIMPAIEKALEKLPIARRMRWGDGEISFVRPVRWVLVLFDDRPITGELFGLRVGATTRGHRFMSDARALPVKKIDDYAALLKKNYVIADFESRRQNIAAQIKEACQKLGAGVKAVDDAQLLEEVTAMVEWPRAIVGEFDAKYLQLPQEVLIEVMRSHQRYFALRRRGKLLNKFITIANIRSRRPTLIRNGNQRVIRPRLADAEFFYRKDAERTLTQLAPKLKQLAFHRHLGSVHDQSQRIAKLASTLGERLGLNEVERSALQRGAELCKADLLTEMVQEMPKLQGVIGEHYALRDGEDAATAATIREHYLPRFAGDALPTSAPGQALALAQRLDGLCGIFNIESSTGGSHDPFGMRRSALGVIHILLDGARTLDLRPILAEACANYRAQGFELKHADADARTLDFLLERLRGVWEGRHAHNVREAILASRPGCLVDAERRCRALDAFMSQTEALAFAEAFKRASNILRANPVASGQVETRRLIEPAEQALADAVSQAGVDVGVLIDAGRYSEALQGMARLASPVDKFFTEVMVICEDAELKQNRLRLLKEIDDIFSKFADISKL